MIPPADTSLAERSRSLRVLAASAALAAALACACGGPGIVDPRPPVFGERDSVFTDTQLLQATYSDYRLPPGFYTEPASDLSFFYVNTGSIREAHYRPAPPWTELSTEDVAQARTWADSTVAYGQLVAPLAAGAPLVSERYFEFQPERPPGFTPVRMRVHRASYLRDCLTFLPGDSGTLAHFQHRPVDLESVHLLAEYLWHHGSSGPLLGKILSSYASDAPGEVTNTMFGIHRIVGDYGVQDVIELVRVDHRVSKLTGEVRFSFKLIRTIKGRSN